MAQHDYVIANGSGAAVRSDLNNALAAIVSQNSGATEPSPTYAYQRWADTTAGVMKMRNGANNAWITLYQLDGEWSTIAFENGTAAAPSIYFKDSGTDTGIYSPGADQVAISAGGIGRVFVDASGKVGVGTIPLYSFHATETIAVTSAASYSAFLGQGTRADLVLKATSSNNDQQRQVIRSDSDSLIFGTENAAVSVFTEKLRVDSSGRLIVGVIASPAHQLQVATDSAGKPSTNTWTIVSDERIKEDIELADLSLCYQAVKDIPLKRYKWKNEVYTEEQVHDRRKLGWISQDVKAVFPKAVRISEFKYNQVFSEETKELVSEDIIEDCHDLNADQLYAAMYGAIQMLMVKVEALEATVAAFELGA